MQRSDSLYLYICIILDMQNISQRQLLILALTILDNDKDSAQTHASCSDVQYLGDDYSSSPTIAMIVPRSDTALEMNSFKAEEARKEMKPEDDQRIAYPRSNVLLPSQLQVKDYQLQ